MVMVGVQIHHADEELSAIGSVRVKYALIHRFSGEAFPHALSPGLLDPKIFKGSADIWDCTTLQIDILLA